MIARQDGSIRESYSHTTDTDLLSRRVFSYDLDGLIVPSGTGYETRENQDEEGYPEHMSP